MSKVICDVCGTAYPETAAQCPICNSARNSAEQTSAATTGKNESDTSGYVYVKGGRFSKKNVKKRSRAGAAAAKHQGSRGGREDEPSGNTGLIIVVVLLMLAIVAVVGYICVHFFGLSFLPDNTDDPVDTKPPVSQTDATDPTQADVPCQSMQLSNAVIEFTEEGESWTIDVELSPVDTTDTVSFATSDPAVVTVDGSGTVTAVGRGTAEVTVTCGDVVQTCTVTCSFGQEETEPEPTAGEFEFAFNTVFTDSTTGYGDLTLDAQGKTWRAYKNDVSVSPFEITWTSDDPNVCTIEDGIVTAVGPGKTLIHAQYNGVTYTCIVRCSFTVAEPVDPQETEPENNEGGEGNAETEATDPSNACVISHTDVTLVVDTSFTLTLKDSEGNVLDVTWEVDKEGYVTIDGNKITGVAHNLAGVKVSATYEDVTYTCIVRIN